MFDCIKEDLRRNIFLKSMLIMLLFRIANWFGLKGRLGQIVGAPFIIFYVFVSEWLLGVEIHYKTRIGPGFVIYHGVGLVINGYTQIGRNVSVRQGCCLGNKVLPDGSLSGAPVIGDGVDMGVNSVVLGNITVGNNTSIGANAVVVKDCESNSVYVGVPARKIK